jgi:hypothetical protein
MGVFWGVDASDFFKVGFGGMLLVPEPPEMPESTEMRL